MKLSSYVWSSVLFLGLLAYGSCSLTGIKGNGNVVKVEKSINAFTELELNGVFDVILTQGDKEKLEIETDENLIEIVTIKNEGNKLIVDFKKGTKIKKSTKFNIYITLVDVSIIEMNGVGDISSTNTLNLKTVELKNSGVGDMDLNINASIANIENSGVGDVKLEGSVNHLIVDNSGVGDVNTESFKTKDAKVANSGVGDVKVYSSEIISINNSGVGDVDFYGNPTKKDITNGGVGKVYER